MPADGNCQFHALAHPNASHSEVRAQIVAHLRTHWDRFAPFVDDDHDAYLRRMARAGTWGDEVTLAAFAERYDTPVHVHRARPPYVRVATYRSTGRRPAKRLLYDGCHYDVLE